MKMRKEVVDFRLAVIEVFNATLKPQPECFYGYAKRPTELMMLYEAHNEAITRRAKPLSHEEIVQSIKFAAEFQRPSLELERATMRIRRLTDVRNRFKAGKNHG